MTNYGLIMDFWENCGKHVGELVSYVMRWMVGFILGFNLLDCIVEIDLIMVTIGDNY